MIVVFIIWLIRSLQRGSFAIVNHTGIASSFSQFVALEWIDEYVIAFGSDQQQLMQKLKQDAATELAYKGRMHKSVEYDKAAKAAGFLC